jgi:hypothetical protein
VPNFIEDAFAMPTKVDKTAMPGAEDPDEYFRATDYNEQRTAFSDIRDRLVNCNDWFGDGSDGDVTIAVDTTLTRNMYYDDLTVDTGITLNPGGFQVFVKGTLTLSGTGKIARNGNAGAAATAIGPGNGGAALSGGLFTSTTAGGSGGTSNGNASNAVLTSCWRGATAGGNGGAGWRSGVGAVSGGTAGNTTARPATDGDVRSLPFALSVRSFNYANEFRPGSSGAGGGGGVDVGTAYGGGGGGSGGVLVVAAKEITGTGTLEANGGAGGAGHVITNNYGGGGGGGGAGGIAVVVYRYGSPTVTANGGGGGAAANLGTGAATAGASGGAGLALTFKV